MKLKPTDVKNKPVLIDLGCGMVYCAPPEPDLNDMTNAMLGSQKRVLFKNITKNKGHGLRKFRNFVRKFIKEHLKPIEPDSDRAPETWLENNKSYTFKEKEELLKKWEKMNKSEGEYKDPMIIKVKQSFIKDETYTQFKYSRGIHGRTDEFKLLLGPVAKLIEKYLFQESPLEKFFIKKIPVPDRPSYLMDNVFAPGFSYFCNDYTGFEGLLGPEFMAACEFQLYTYMVSILPDEEKKRFNGMFRAVCFGKNHMTYKNVNIDVSGCRMSGEMFTSLGNGFSNLMVVLYWFSLQGVTDINSIHGVVEGDDSLFRMSVIPPSIEFYDSLGLVAKPEVIADIREASFCGQVFSDTSSVICDPNKVLLNFGWTSSKYMHFKDSFHLSLLRAKAWSLGYQYKNCPILSSMARCYLRLTRSYEVINVVKYMPTYKREEFLNMLDIGRPELNPIITEESRLLMEKLYKVSPEQQRAYETYFDNLNCLEPIPDFGLNIHNDCYVYKDMYVLDVFSYNKNEWNWMIYHQPQHSTNLIEVSPISFQAK